MLTLVAATHAVKVIIYRHCDKSQMAMRVPTWVSTMAEEQEQ